MGSHFMQCRKRQSHGATCCSTTIKITQDSYSLSLNKTFQMRCKRFAFDSVYRFPLIHFIVGRDSIVCTSVGNINLLWRRMFFGFIIIVRVSMWRVSRACERCQCENVITILNWKIIVISSAAQQLSIFTFFVK